MSDGWGPETWFLVVGSGVLTLVLPVVSVRMAARQHVLEELYLSSRPGWVLGGLVALAGVVGIPGAGAALLAIAYPFMWATAALCASGVLSIVLFAMAYVKVARRRRGELAPPAFSEPCDEPAEAVTGRLVRQRFRDAQA